MTSFRRITVLLKESPDDTAYNKQILEYLNDRHQELNNANYAIGIEIVDDSNINKFIRLGVSSTPALMLEDNIEYGVSSIIAILAKLEITQEALVPTKAMEPDNDAHYQLVMEEMRGDEQEDEHSSSSVKPKHQDYSESPMSEGDIQSRMSKYSAIYDARKQKDPRNKQKATPAPKTKNVSSARADVEKLISSKGYDRGEAAFMREIAKNLE